MTRDGTAVVAATLTYRHLRTALTIALAVGVQPCAWSLDDARIVFGASTADGKSSVYITTPEGADFEELTAHDPSASFPVWSHDGRAIAFSYSPVGLGISIHLMDPDGRNVRRISVPLGPAHLDWEATWSPRDDAIAFTSARMGHDRMGIYLVDVDGGPERRLTGTNTWSRRANWRPIGDTMAYQSSSTGSMDIHIMDGQGGDLGQLTDRPRHDGAPSWHPRTKAIAFESWGENDDNVDIHTMDADGSDEQRLTTHPTDDRKPSWSPDGTQILFESHRDGVMGLYIMNRDGRIVRKVTDDRLLGRPGAWLTDLHGASWFDPAVPRSVSPVGRRATTWGWLKRLGTGRPNP
jgi:Tol biopolymer transport system component